VSEQKTFDELLAEIQERCARFVSYREQELIDLIKRAIEIDETTGSKPELVDAFEAWVDEAREVVGKMESLSESGFGDVLRALEKIIYYIHPHRERGWHMYPTRYRDDALSVLREHGLPIKTYQDASDETPRLTLSVSDETPYERMINAKVCTGCSSHPCQCLLSMAHERIQELEAENERLKRELEKW
jgi:hypothetical protein